MFQVIKHFTLFLSFLFFQKTFFPIYWQFKYYIIKFCSDFVGKSGKFERHGCINRHGYNWKQPLFQWRDSQNHTNTTWHNQYCDNFQGLNISVSLSKISRSMMKGILIYKQSFALMFRVLFHEVDRKPFVNNEFYVQL